MASQNTDKYEFHITGGPNKFDIMVSLFEGNPQHRRTVEFELAGLRKNVKVAITGVQQESGSGESWNIEGWVMDGPSAHVECYYNSYGRSGHFKFVVPTRVSLEGGRWIETINAEGEQKLATALNRLRA